MTSQTPNYERLDAPAWIRRADEAPRSLDDTRAVRAPIKAWIRGVECDESAREQLELVASLPVVAGHLAVMPDVHRGTGATVGSVIPTRRALVPSAVGVDIGCGMTALELDVRASELPDNLHVVRDAIERAVPHGFSSQHRNHVRGGFVEVSNATLRAWRDQLAGDYARIIAENKVLSKETTVHQLGTLGTGNHFIELCVDEQEHVWVMLHSGSRGIGNRIGTLFIEKARRDCERRGTTMPSRDLGWLEEGTELFDQYWRALEWAQRFAKLNREIMMTAVIEAIRPHIPVFGRARKLRRAVDCHHNYAAIEHHFGEDIYVTRKGAVRAGEGELGIIPGSMGARSFIVRGKGSADSYCSCSHGAGRRLSRNSAKKLFTVADHIAATKHVECRKDETVLDETPMAYKDIDAVMQAQSDLVEVVATLRQVVCVKG